MFGTRKLGKTSAQRKALLRQQVTDLLANGKMETTFYRAKEVQPVVEKMITLGKKGDLAAYRKALSFITKEDVAHKLFKEIAPKYADRNGGYTRVTRTGERRGDAAEMAVIELVYSGIPNGFLPPAHAGGFFCIMRIGLAGSSANCCLAFRNWRSPWLPLWGSWLPLTGQTEREHGLISGAIILLRYPLSQPDGCQLSQRESQGHCRASAINIICQAAEQADKYLL